MADRGTHCKFGHEYSRRPNGRQVCKVCEKARIKRERPKNRAALTDYMRGYRERNREHFNAGFRARRREKVDLLDQLKEVLGCYVCGEKRIPCLDFHHRDPAQKRGNVSVEAGSRSLEWLIAEAEKCDVICANCHRVLHWEERRAGTFRLGPRQ